MGRRVTTGVTLLILCGIVALGAVYGWNSLFAELPDTESSAEDAGPSCTDRQVRAGQRLRSRQVRVSVFNAGTRAGLAEATLETLVGRGFKPGETGNAPDDVKVRAVQVWSTERRDIQARLVAQQFGRRTKVVFSDVDLGPGVDVVVGNSFKGVRRNASTFLKLRRPSDVCVPVPSQEADPEPSATPNAQAAR